MASSLHAAATNYYVGSNGNDGVAQPTALQPWKSVAKVNALQLGPGDSVLFRGDDSLSGSISLTSEDAGSATSPVVISSYGNGRAVIVSGASDGLNANGCRYIKVSRLAFVGASRLTGAKAGCMYNGVRDSYIDSVYARGYNWSGIDLKSSVNVRLTNSYVTDNGTVGILLEGSTDNCYVGYCKAINNPGYPTSPGHSGNGILMYHSPKNCVIEYCESAENGWDMGNPNGGFGPGGIWTESADNILIQFCISHNNKTTKNHSDGVGFDFDARTTNCTMQYCYSYQNDGSGYFYCENTAGPSTNNVVRYCISEDDGSMSGSFHGGLLVNGGNQSGGRFYNNILYTTALMAGADRSGNPRRSSCVWLGDQSDQQLLLYNNIFILKGSGPIVSNMHGTAFRNNLFWCVGGGTPTWTGYNAQGAYTTYRSLEEWANGTGNEKINGQFVGVYADPLLANAGSGEKLTDPTKLPQLFAYLIKPGSPCIDKGVDLQALGINPGTRDFYGRAIPYGTRLDIGACEYDGNPVAVANRFLALCSGVDIDGGAMRSCLTVRTAVRRISGMRQFDCAGKLQGPFVPAGILVQENTH